MSRSVLTTAGVDVHNPKARRRKGLCVLHGGRLQTQNAAAYDVISPKVFGEEPNAAFQGLLKKQTR